MVFIFGLGLMQAAGQGTVTGTILDKMTGEALAGANITNQQQLVGTSSAEDGTFFLELAAGKHDISISMVGYTGSLTSVQVGDRRNTDLGRIFLSPEVIGLAEIKVISSLAVDRRSPLTVSTIRAEMIETRLGDEPLPEVMKMVPGVYATRTGGGSGDAALNIRGFKQENITLLLNGIPISSVENGEPSVAVPSERMIMQFKRVAWPLPQNVADSLALNVQLST